MLTTEQLYLDVELREAQRRDGRWEQRYALDAAVRASRPRRSTGRVAFYMLHRISRLLARGGMLFSRRGDAACPDEIATA